MDQPFAWSWSLSPDAIGRQHLFCSSWLSVYRELFSGLKRNVSWRIKSSLSNFFWTNASGFLINQLDLAPNFSGTIYGVISGLASVNSWLAPLVVASLTEAQVDLLVIIELMMSLWLSFFITLQQTLTQWRIAFLLCSSILAVDAVVFLVLGSTERQSWDKDCN